MKRFVALCLVAVALATAPAFSDFKNGVYTVENRDYETAFSVADLQPLAEQGDADAQFYLGGLYVNGSGVLQDYKEAMKWWKLSAQQRHAQAQNGLGWMYARGRGVPQDYVRAHMWLNLAASNGAEYAPRNRDNIAKEMTSAQIVEAQDLARECVAKDYKGC